MVPSMWRETSIQGVDVLNLSAPLYAQFEITAACNYRCQMCYNVWRLGSPTPSIPQLPLGQLLSAIDRLAPYVFSMIISGGEPTLVAEWRRLMMWCRFLCASIHKLAIC